MMNGGEDHPHYGGILRLWNRGQVVEHNMGPDVHGEAVYRRAESEIFLEWEYQLLQSTRW